MTLRPGQTPGMPGRLPGMIVLAGGLGSRLRDSIDPDLPKVLAPIHGRPFIDYLLAWLQHQQVPRVRFALGHRADAVIRHLQQVAGSLSIAVDWRVEATPLGTAGALAVALADHPPAAGPCLVMNGDTLVDVTLDDFCRSFAATGTALGLVAATVPDAARYGALELDAADRILRFAEKEAASGAAGGTWINAGIYLLTQGIVEQICLLARGSLERQILAALPEGRIWAFRGARRFIDIGTADSLAAAHRLLAPLQAPGFAGPLWRAPPAAVQAGDTRSSGP